MQIIAKIILHSIYVLNYAKVYVKHNIFHKKNPNTWFSMFFKVKIEGQG